MSLHFPPMLPTVYFCINVTPFRVLPLLSSLFYIFFCFCGCILFTFVMLIYIYMYNIYMASQCRSHPQLLWGGLVEPTSATWLATTPIQAPPHPAVLTWVFWDLLILSSF
ncbi:hypothetical protein HanIR_Chr17g0866021 [Helianthus annuus]|nr:hypothetical protein HanIR_Chr17g0866021 [Helianthus annuus]